MFACMICATPSPRTPSCRDVPLPVVARLLGHRRADMTLRYTHVGDGEVEAAAERVGQSIARLMAGVTTTGGDT